MIATDEIDLEVRKGVSHAGVPRVIERHTCQFGEDVDASWSDANLVGYPRAREVALRDRFHRGSEGGQRTHDPRGVSRSGVDPQVQNASGTRAAVNRQRIRTNDQEPHVSDTEGA